MTTDRQKLAAYMRDWAKANPDKIRARSKREYAASRQKLMAKARAWRTKNPDATLLIYARQCLARSTGLRFAEIPLDIAKVKALHLAVERAIKGVICGQAIVDTRPEGQDAERGLGLPSGDGAACGNRPTSIGISKTGGA